MVGGSTILPLSSGRFRDKMRPSTDVLGRCDLTRGSSRWHGRELGLPRPPSKQYSTCWFMSKNSWRTHRNAWGLRQAGPAPGAEALSVDARREVIPASGAAIQSTGVCPLANRGTSAVGVVDQ
jgi:hypothetical protein